MTNLIKIEKLELNLSNVSSEEREIILATENTKIKYLNNKDFVLEMNNILLTTFFDSGQTKLNEDDQTTLLMTVSHDLLRDYGYITLDEIKIAYRKGVRKQYGEYFGLSPVTFYNWVVKYMSESRSEAMRLKKVAMGKLIEKNSQSLPPTPEEWNKIMYKSCIELFERYKRNKLEESKEWIYDIGNVHFKFLNDIGLIPKWDSTVIQEKVKAKINRERLSLPILSPKQKIDNFLKTISVESEEMKAILEDFFDKLILENKDFKALLDERLKM